MIIDMIANSTVNKKTAKHFRVIWLLGGAGGGGGGCTWVLLAP